MLSAGPGRNVRWESSYLDYFLPSVVLFQCRRRLAVGYGLTLINDYSMTQLQSSAPARHRRPSSHFPANRDDPLRPLEHDTNTNLIIIGPIDNGRRHFYSVLPKHLYPAYPGIEACVTQPDFYVIFRAGLHTPNRGP